MLAAALLEQLDALAGAGQRREDVGLLAGHAQPLPAGGEDPDVRDSRRAAPWLTERADASTCSQLSSTSRVGVAPTCSITSASGSSCFGVMPSASATTDPMLRPPGTVVRSTNQTPPGHVGAMARPSSMARRVLPIPPGPTMVATRPGADQLGDVGPLPPAADEGVGGPAQVVAVGGHGPEGRRRVRWAAGRLDAPQLGRAVEVA